MSSVSVIMNCHNSGKYLPQAIDSVYQQTFKDYEIIFWDNQSTDNSGEIALSYGKPLRYFRGETFLPLGAARNAAIEKAQGKYLAFLDCDDIWLPGKLEGQVGLLESNKELGLVYSDCYIINGNGNARENTYFYGLNPVRGRVFNELFRFNIIPLLTVVIRKDILDKTGVFNPKYEIAEEYDLWLRIAERYPVDFIEQPLAKYRLYSDSVSQKNIILAYQEELQIINYWLKRNPGLKKNSGSSILKRKSTIYRAMLSTGIRRILGRRNVKSVAEFGKLLKYLMLSKN